MLDNKIQEDIDEDEYKGLDSIRRYYLYQFKNHQPNEIAELKFEFDFKGKADCDPNRLPGESASGIVFFNVRTPNVETNRSEIYICQSDDWDNCPADSYIRHYIRKSRYSTSSRFRYRSFDFTSSNVTEGALPRCSSGSKLLSGEPRIRCQVGGWTDWEHGWYIPEPDTYCVDYADGHLESIFLNYDESLVTNTIFIEAYERWNDGGFGEVETIDNVKASYKLWEYPENLQFIIGNETVDIVEGIVKGNRTTLDFANVINKYCNRDVSAGECNVSIVLKSDNSGGIFTIKEVKKILRLSDKPISSPQQVETETTPDAQQFGEPKERTVATPKLSEDIEEDEEIFINYILIITIVIGLIIVIYLIKNKFFRKNY